MQIKTEIVIIFTFISVISFTFLYWKQSKSFGKNDNGFIFRYPTVDYVDRETAVEKLKVINPATKTHNIHENEFNIVWNTTSADITESIAADASSCSAHTTIMFMKTHKTASTAMQNILLRFAEKKELQVGLPAGGDSRFNYGQKFSRKYVLKTIKPISIICHHMIFNYKEVKSVMPPNAKYVTIIRDTGSLFDSMFDYMHYSCTPFSRVEKSPSAIDTWISNPGKYFHGKGDGHYWWFAKNAMFFDLGFNNLNETDEYINSAIQKLDEQFQLVLISDYFDESAILLKDLLCWDFEDILFMKSNSRDEASVTKMSEVTKSKIKHWNKADAMLFDHFNKTFWRKVKKYGVERMRRDVERLNEMNKKLKNDCVEGGASVANDKITDESNKIYNPKGVHMVGYNLKESAKNNRTCVNLLKSEVPFTLELIKRLKMSISTTKLG